MLLRFSKMHGLGNDFVVLDGVRQKIELNAEQLRHIANRRFGIGCDQILLVEPAGDPEQDFRYRIFNADGGEVEQCGNGARCFARFVRAQGLTDKDRIRVETNSGPLVLSVQADGQVTVDMGRARLQPEQIPFRAPQRAAFYSLPLNGQTVEFGAVSMGNPHAVLTVADVDTAAVAELGKALQADSHFPVSVNVGFMQILRPEHIRLRVYERGVGETLACGSGACAAVVVGRLQNRLARSVRVDLPGGSLTIDWPDESAAVQMTGPASFVFEGGIEL